MSHGHSPMNDNMASQDDDWETADLSLFGESSKGKKKSEKHDLNLRPSAPTFLPRPSFSSTPQIWKPETGRTGNGVTNFPGNQQLNDERIKTTISGSRRSQRSGGTTPDDDEDDAWNRSAPAAMSNRQLWQAANAPSPVIPPLASDLPPVAPVASGNMRILRRPSPSSAPASGSSTPTGGPKPVKTLSEREEEYRRARERIFAEDKAKEQKAKDNERAREKPRDSVDEVIRAAEAMVLAGENEAESSRGGYGGGAVRNRGRQKSKQTLQDDDFETRTELAMRSSSVEIMYPSITPYGIPLPYMSTGTPGRLPSRSGSGTTSPIGPGGFNDPYGGVDSYMVPLRNPSEIGIVRQPRGPVAGEGTGFGALRSGPAAGATR